MTSEALRLHIDWTRCDGRGLCTELLPELLTRDDWGYPLTKRPGDPIIDNQRIWAASYAAALCPRLALSLVPQHAPRP
jgi:ferredoxin